MPKRFVDATEQSLIRLLQETMKQHNPWTGLKGKAVGILRDITIPKPQDAHNLSVFVTEDFLAKISNTYEKEHVGSAFMNVLSLADEEVREHYLRADRSPTFARILIEFRNALKSGLIRGSISDLSTFTDFIDTIVDTSKGTDDEITYEEGMYISAEDTMGVESGPTPMEKALADSTGTSKRKKKNDAQSHTAVALRLGAKTREDIETSAIEILIGQDYRLLSPDWLLMRSLAIAYLLKRKELGLPVAERCPAQEDLEDMFHQERKCAVLLYGCVLLSTYVEEIRQAAVAAYEKANPKVSKILKMCRKVSQHSGKMLVAYTAIMLSSLIATAASGGVGAGAIAGSVLGYTAAGGMLAASAPQLGLLAAQGVKTLGNALGITTAGAAEAAAATAVAGTAVESTTAAAGGAAAVATFESPVALPATLANTLMLYITLPRVMFSGYEGEWIRKYTESDGGKREFKPPSIWSPIIASMGIKLIMNTLLGITPHIKYKPFTAALGWSLYRLYLPLSLIEQPSKVRNAYEVAISATSRTGKSNFPYSTKTTVACCLIGLVVELALHAAGFHLPSEVSMALNFIVKTARVASWIGPVVHAKKHGNPVYTREFEQIFWTDGFKALTAPPILLLFELASGSPAFNTAVLAGDVLISVIPEVICGNKLGALNVASGKIVSLESLMRTALSQKSILELSVAMAMQDQPAVAQERTQALLEKHFGKDQYRDLGLDIKVDEDGTRNLSLEAERKWRTVIENAVSSDNGDTALSAERIQELITGLASVYKGSNGSANPEAEDCQKVLKVLESQHPFIAALTSSTLTDAQKEAMKASADKLGKLDASAQKSIKAALDKFEEEYHERLIATMTNEQRGMLTKLVDKLLQDSSLPNGLDKQKKKELTESVKRFRDRVKHWSGSTDPWKEISSSLTVSDLNKIAAQPERHKQLELFFEEVTGRPTYTPFDSHFDRQFCGASTDSSLAPHTSGRDPTKMRVTHGPRAAGGTQTVKNQKGEVKKYVEVRGEIVREEVGGAHATQPEGRKTGSWDSMVLDILHQDDKEREAAIGAMLKGELPQQSIQSESPQAKGRGNHQAQQETSLSFGAQSDKTGENTAPDGASAEGSTDEDDDDREIENLFKQLFALPTRAPRNDADVSRHLQNVQGFLSGLGTQSGRTGGNTAPDGASAEGSYEDGEDEEIRRLFDKLLKLPSHIMDKSEDEILEHLLQDSGGDTSDRDSQEAARASSTHCASADGIEVLKSKEHAQGFFNGTSSRKSGTVFEYSNSQQLTEGQQKPPQNSSTAGLKPQMVTHSGQTEEEFEIEIDNLPKHSAVNIKGLNQEYGKSPGNEERNLEFFFGEDGKLLTADGSIDYFSGAFLQDSESTAPQKSRTRERARPKAPATSTRAKVPGQQPSTTQAAQQRPARRIAARPSGKMTLDQLWSGSFDDTTEQPSRIVAGSSATQPGTHSRRAR